MANYFDFSSDKIDIFLILLDESGSMSSDAHKVMEGLAQYRKSFHDFPEVNSIAVSVCTFNDTFHPGEFTHIDNMSFNYSPDGSTALAYSIIEAADYLNEYMQEVAKRTNCKPRGTFIVFSDGEPYKDLRYPQDAINVIENLNYSGINTVFVAFKKAISTKFGESWKFQSTVEVRKQSELIQFLGVELSKSCKEQSMSMTSLGANFFSKASGSQSEGYSQKAQQALDDDSWIDEL